MKSLRICQQCGLNHGIKQITQCKEPISKLLNHLNQGSQVLNGRHIVFINGHIGDKKGTKRKKMLRSVVKFIINNLNLPLDSPLPWRWLRSCSAAETKAANKP